MREWRKVYKSVSTSDKAGNVSDSAFALYMLALLHQDDAGRIPWNRPFARSITATRDWSWSETETFAKELMDAGLVTIDDGFMEIAKGKELNGKPRDAKRELLYPSGQNHGSPVVTTTERRGVEEKESRGEEKEKRVEGADALTPLPDGEPQVWPEWYSLLWGVDGFKASFETAEKWRGGHGVSEELAVDKAYALRDWWPRQPPARRRDGDPYKTWQNWCREDGKKPSPNGVAHLTIEDFPTPEPPETDRQAHATWANDRETWWQANRPRPSPRARGP